jgi:hypothetical protein
VPNLACRFSCTVILMDDYDGISYQSRKKRS